MTPILTPWQFLFLIIGFISPKVIAFGQDPKWSKIQKFSVNVAFNILIAAVALGSGGLLTLANLSGSVILLVMYSTLSYLGIWKPNQLNEKTFQLRKSAVRGIKRSLGVKVNEKPSG